MNPFGVVALAALVGMFADTATQKLGEIFDTLFKTQAQNKDPLAPLQITTAALPDGTVNTPYALQLTARGAGPNASWTALGLPPGFVLDLKTGLLHGTTAAALPATPISITLADGAGHSDHKTLMLTVH